MTTKITTVNKKSVFYLSAFNSSWYVEHFFRYKQIYGEKLLLVQIRENKLFRHRPEAIGRPVIDTHHIHMNEHIFFWMLRAQMIKICNVEMKIWSFTSSAGAFLKWLSRRKWRKPKIKISVSQHLIITDIHNLSLDVCFWGWQIRWYLLKILYISKRTSKSMMAAKLSVWNQLMCQS